MTQDWITGTDMDTAKPTRYDIVDRHTGAVVGSTKTLKAATRSVDRRDDAYGAYRYSHRAIWG